MDLDGTLLNGSLSIPKATEAYLKELVAKGHQIILASGRPWRSIKPFYKALGLSTPVIALNGALVFNPKNQEFPVKSMTFPKDHLKKIARIMGKKITSFMAESDGIIPVMYLKREDNYLNHYFPYKELEYTVGPMEEIIERDCATAIFRCAHKNVAELKDVVESEPGVKFRHWRHSFYSEAHLEGIDKGAGLRYIQEQLGIKKEDTFAFGDSDNDLEMLEAAGHSFVMPNAKTPYLFERFEVALGSNEEDGVKLTLEKFIA